MEIVVVEVGGVRYGLPATSVRELLRAVAIVPLPSAPAPIEGVVDVRGRVVPVLDIRRRFRLAPRSVQPSDHFVLATAGELLVLVRVDTVLELQRLDPLQIDEAARVVPAAEYIAGIARLPDGLVLVHDLATFLTPDEATALDEATPVALPLIAPADRDILTERARLLAKPLVDDELGTDAMLEVVVAHVGGERYAIDTRNVIRVAPIVEITPVPGAPGLLLGIANLQGEALPIFDPLRLFGAVADDPPRDIMVIGRDRPELGLAVSRADRVAQLPLREIVAAPAAIASETRALMRGVSTDGIVILDGERLLADRRLFLHART